MKAKYLKVVVAMLVCGFVLFTGSVGAKDNPTSYSFTVKPFWKEQGRDNHGKFRESKNLNNPWKVSLTSTTEGSGNGNNYQTNFCLTDYNHERVSNYLKVIQGKGYFTKEAYAEMVEKVVYIAAEDNGFNFSSYSVKGAWDEER